MTCCNNQCEQGRACPAKVARIGRKDYAREELPPSIWRLQLRRLAIWMLICLALMFSAALVGVLAHA